MKKSILYFYNHSSPWTYLGHERFLDIARENDAEVRFRPCESHRIFAVSGGLPVGQRSPQRQAYRLAELRRWREYLNMPLVIQSAHAPVPMAGLNRLVIAAQQAGEDTGRLSSALLRARWAEDCDLADQNMLLSIAEALGMNGEKLLAASRSESIGALYDAYTQEAIDRQVFGAPTYIYGDESFWGQDRLDFVLRALAKT
jgi:2-hydroxychromene-2-carboxylate isomerase